MTLKNNYRNKILKILTVGLIILTSGCPNNLVDTIDDAVEVVVTPPSIEGVYPLANATGVSIDTEITITFSKQIESTSINGSTLSVKTESGSSASGRYDTSNETVTFTPNNLYYGTVYTVTATEAILDIDGNPFTEEYAWSFTTQSAPAGIKPVVQDFVANGGKSATSSSDVELSIFATDYLGDSAGLQFRYKLDTESEWSDWLDMESGVGTADVTLGISGEEDQTFLYEAEVRDTNMVLSDSSFTEITYKTSPPAVDTDLSNPEPGSVVPQNQAYIKVVFNAEMDPGTITTDSVYVSKGTSVISTASYSLVDNKTGVEFSEFELDGDPYTLEQNTEYTVFISNTVADIAGNFLESDYTYSFTTDSADDNEAPDGQVVLDLDNAENNATGLSTIDLMIHAEDLFNGVRAVKIWGDNLPASGLPTFESDADWQLYSENDETDGPDEIPDNGDGISYMSYSLSFGSNWQFESSDGDKYIYYRFIDYANNESETPGRLKISLDTTAPDLNELQVDSGSGYSNNSGDTVNVVLDAVDLTSGLSEMWISTEASDVLSVPASGSGSWEDWSSLKTGVELDSGEGHYYVYAEVKDFVNNASGVNYTSVILDYTKPSISYEDDDILEVNNVARQSLTAADLHPASSPLGYQVPSGIKSYQWEQLSGPGTLGFYLDEAKTTPDSSAALPYIAASTSDGTEDGEYEIKVTVSDYAGNSSYTTIPFYWDTIEPADIGIVTAYDEDDLLLTDSDNTVIEYTTSKQPYAVWEDVPDTDFYTIITSSSEFNPNLDPGVQYGDGSWYPHWDDDEVDWDNDATYSDKGYIKSDTPFISAPAPDTPGDNDGPTYVYIAGWDNAGNRSNTSSHRFVKFWIDTLAPVIDNINDLEPSNIAFAVDYRNNSDLGNGRIYDQRTADDPSGGTTGSGIASYLWEQNAGDGTLTIQNADSVNPTVSAASDGSEDGQYELKLTVTDVAGNSSESFIGFVWDTTDPGPVVVTGPAYTPDRTPTWSWTSGGGGNGTFEYILKDESGIGVAPYDTWIETVNTYFTPADNLDDASRYTLYVREYDDADNVSDDTAAVSRFEIDVNSSYVTAPTVSRTGLYLRNALDRTVVWNLSSGIGTTDNGTYRYRLENSDGVEKLSWTEDGLNDNIVELDFELMDLDDGVYTLFVEEYDTINFTYPDDGDQWKGLIGTSSVEIDATAPGKPVMDFSYTTGSTTSGDDSSYYITNDTTPRFWWSSGGGGNSSYRWSFNGSDWTNTNYYYVYTSNAEGVYTFYVQERDTAGNWSDSTEYNLEIDTTAPTLSSILLKNRIVNPANSTSYTVSPYVDINVTGSGENLQTYTSGDIRYMRFWNTGGSKYAYTANGAVSTKESWYFGNGGGDLSDGSKTVYCELVDYAGNVSVTRYDSITLDTTPPVVSSFNINSGATTTTSSSTTLYSSYDDAVYMRISNNGGSSWTGWYSATTSKSWTLDTSNGDNGYGAKKVMVEFTDLAGINCRSLTTNEAGHETTVEDSIFYGTPNIKYSTKGSSTTGYIYTYYDNFPSDTGSTNTVYVYYAYTPTGSKYTKGSTTSSSSYSNTYTEGTPYYIFIRVYNPDIGYSNYSNYAFGYSSDIAIIYDDDDDTDSSLASTIKSRIMTDWASVYSTYYMQGSYTWSQYSVTLVPEDEVSNTASSENTIYGDPVIITPGTLFQAYNIITQSYTPYSGKIQNVANGNHGIFAMSYTGSRFLYWLSAYWSSWGISGTQPTDLDYVYGKGYTQYANIKPYYSSFDYIWHRYLYYDYLYTNYKYTEDRDELLFTTDTNGNGPYRYSIYNTNTSGTNGTYFYADDPDYTNYYTVARQGRFVFWGYSKVPEYVNGGIPFFYNIIRYLKTYY